MGAPTRPPVDEVGLRLEAVAAFLAHMVFEPPPPDVARQLHVGLLRLVDRTRLWVEVERQERAA